MRLETPRYFPAGAAIREFPEAALTVGVLAANGKGNPQAIGYYGRAQRPSFNYTFRSTERMEAFIAERIESGKASIKFKAERQATKKAKLAEPNPLKVGDVLLNSWGYDQTNADYYQVTALVGKRSVKIRRIAAESIPGSQGFMSEMVRPVPGIFLDIERYPELLKRVNEYGSVKIHDWGSWARKVNPEEKTYSSWYA